MHSNACTFKDTQAHPSSSIFKKLKHSRTLKPPRILKCIKAQMHSSQSAIKTNHKQGTTFLKIKSRCRTSCKGKYIGALGMHIHIKCFETWFETQIHNDHIIYFKIKFKIIWPKLNTSYKVKGITKNVFNLKLSK